uniref:Signal recognition particle subunit SRP68 n=1 Tax=Phallusia mammillata TaxID=59560 RepID=A0A6F9DU83_9ASCI|nr:signal recognition particle subunit SRP68 [Phallusia mammillata]
MTGVLEGQSEETETMYDAVDPEKTDDNEVIKTEASLFSLDMLHVIKDAQAQHGLRHGDYQRYHGYCNRKLKRIRKVLKFRMGEKRRVTPKKITESLFSDPRYMLMLLMTSERAWSMAMYLKQEATQEPRKRHHMVEKMRKAVVHASELNKLCEESEKVDARTKLEAQAYSCYMSGILQFELKNWVSARDLFRKTQTIYGKLSDAMSKEEQPVYKNMVDEIDPNIRYCAYTIGDQSAMDDLMHIHGTGRQDPLLAGKLDSLIAASRERKAASMSEVTWRNRTIRIKNNKVRLFLIGVKDFDKDLSEIDEKDHESRIEMYDQVLTECKDALQYTREDIRTDPHSKANERGVKVSDLQFLSSYLSYLRLTKMIKRNLLMVDQLQAKAPPLLVTGAGDEGASGDAGRKGPKPTDFIRLYDVVLQNLSEVLSLPGLSGDADLQTEIDVQKRAFQAYRCFYVAQAFVADKKWTEAMALYDRVLEHANYAIKAFQSMDTEASGEFDFLQPAKLELLIEAIAFNRYRVHASAVLDGVKDKPKNPVDTKLPLCDRLEDFVDDPAISSLNNKKPNAKTPSMTSSFPPPFEPVPCKPLFFDLALNHACFPSLESKLGQKQQKAGLTSMLSTWWGWGGKK